jgi:hypothetical protein
VCWCKHCQNGRGTVSVSIIILWNHDLTKSWTIFGITTRVNPPKIFRLCSKQLS